VAVGNCCYAEQYGVPQTRKRAILVARAPWMRARYGPAALPAPTHSRYYPRNPAKLDAGLPRWVSMAEALGWGMTARPYPTLASGRTTGGPDREKVGGSEARRAIYAERDAGRWVQQSNYSAPGHHLGLTTEERGLGERPTDVPSFAVTSKGFHWSMLSAGATSPETAGTVPRDAEDAPAGTITGKGTAAWVMRSSVSPEGTNKARPRPVDEPSATITGKHRSAEWEYVNGTHDHATRRPADAPAPAVHFGPKLNTVEWQMSSGTRENAALRAADEPSPTLALGHDAASYAFVPAGLTAADVAGAKADGTAVRVSIEEAAVLQSFPADYPGRAPRPPATARSATPCRRCWPSPSWPRSPPSVRSTP
jgi:DNA (cytosine-5)-methyltransferase 1